MHEREGKLAIHTWMLSIHSCRSLAESACSAYVRCGETSENERRSRSLSSCLMVEMHRFTTALRSSPLLLERWYSVPSLCSTNQRRCQTRCVMRPDDRLLSQPSFRIQICGAQCHKSGQNRY